VGWCGTYSAFAGLSVLYYELETCDAVVFVDNYLNAHPVRDVCLL
jgi:hypothetical protein